MNKEMKKFYKKLVKTENMGVTFSTFNGKIVSSKELDELNIPEGYNIVDGNVYKDGIEIGKMEVYENEDENDIELDSEDFEEISFDDLYEDENEDKNENENNSELDSEDFEEISFDDLYEDDIDNEIEFIDTNDDDENKKVSSKRHKVRNIVKGCLYGIGRGISKFFNHFGKRNSKDENKKVSSKRHKVRNLVKRSLYGVERGISKFFNHFGKRNSIDLPEELNNVNTYDNLPKEETTKDKIIKNFEEIEKTLEVFNKIINENPDLNFETFIKRKDALLEDYNELYIKFANDEEVNLDDVINVKTKWFELLVDTSKYVKSQEVQENKNEPRRFTFESIESTRNKFKEFDAPKKEFTEIEEKIAYYETFLKEHDLSHAEDQAMKERMKEKLNALKERYNVIKEANSDKKVVNEKRNEEMAYYTQISSGIDKEIESLEIDRQIRLLQFKKNSDLQLDADETRAIYDKKDALLKLKEECLERKEKLNKYYEDQAARMTQALKR